MGVFSNPWRGHSPFEPMRRPPRRGARTYRSSQAYDNSNQAQASNSDTSQDAANKAREAWWAIADFSNLVSRYGFEEAIRINTGRGMRPTDVQNEANMLRDAGLRPEHWSEPPVTPEDIDTGDTGDTGEPFEPEFGADCRADLWAVWFGVRPCDYIGQEVWNECGQMNQEDLGYVDRWITVGQRCGWLDEDTGL